MTSQPGKQGRDTAELVAALDAAERVSGAAELRRRSYDLLGASADAADAVAAPGTGVVDVGCGAGRAVAELGERGIEAVGVDPDERMVALARRRWPGADFRVAGAYQLPFPDNLLSGYRADKVLHELADPARALGEARRVLAAGGRIVLLGQDWEAFVIDSGDPALTRAVVGARADLVTAPRAARGYRGLLLDAGFVDVTVEVRTAVFTGAAALPLLTGLAEGAVRSGAVASERVADWLTEQRARAEVDRLLLAVPVFVAAATAPVGPRSSPL
ncbi:methyltransferase domain-containing protein [Streptomyces collinus]|uniref:methyltransferase domain-containing protein n=1 Tax=Streptomyces collinus TaxID=42684 RepID=UPI0033DEA15F